MNGFGGQTPRGPTGRWLREARPGNPGLGYIDLAAQRARISDRIDAAVARVIEGGRYILGPEVAEFEEKLAAYVGVKHVVACANGTDALLIPLMARGIGPGDAVFCPSFTFAATAEVVALAGAAPVFVDDDADTYNIDLDQLETAIAGVRRAGWRRRRSFRSTSSVSPPTTTIRTIADRPVRHRGAAQSISGTSAGVKCGAFGHVGSTSFYPAKPLGCYGDGGAMLTDDSDLAETLRSIAFHGRARRSTTMCGSA